MWTEPLRAYRVRGVSIAAPSIAAARHCREHVHNLATGREPLPTRSPRSGRDWPSSGSLPTKDEVMHIINFKRSTAVGAALAALALTATPGAYAAGGAGGGGGGGGAAAEPVVAGICQHGLPCATVTTPVATPAPVVTPAPAGGAGAVA